MQVSNAMLTKSLLVISLLLVSFIAFSQNEPKLQVVLQQYIYDRIGGAN